MIYWFTMWNSLAQRLNSKEGIHKEWIVASDSTMNDAYGENSAIKCCIWKQSMWQSDEWLLHTHLVMADGKSFTQVEAVVQFQFWTF